MKRLLILIICLWGSHSWADTLKVRSGEHSDFTRLVIDLVGDIDWSIVKEGAKTHVRISDAATRFDTTSVFSRISRSRIVNLSSAGNTLTINTACDCKVRDHLVGSSMLVLDFTSEAADPRPTQKSLPAELPLNVPTTQQITTLHPKVPLENAQTLPPISPDVSSAQQRLLRQLTGAAAHGLVEVRKSSDTMAPLPPNLLDPDPIGANQLITTTSIEESLRLITTYERGPEVSDPCKFAHEVDPTFWANNRSFTEGVAAYRDILNANEFIEDPQDTLSLAKHYLHFGLSIEAIQLLSRLPRDQSVELLQDLAALFMNTSPNQRSTLTRFHTCPGPAGIWAYLTSVDEGALRALDPQPLQSAFLQLPDDLKVLIGPPLIDRLRSLGQTSAAETVSRINFRTFAGAATLDVSANKNAGLIASIEQFAQKDTPSDIMETVKARFPSSAEEGRDEIQSLAQSELLQSYVYELGKNDGGGKLQHAELLALAKTDQFGDAFTLLEKMSSEGMATTAMRRTLEAELISNSDDITFLTVVSNQTSRGHLMSAHNAQSAADRLIALGFADLATRVAESDKSANLPSVRRQNRARVLADDQDFQGALAELMGLETPEALELRAAVLQEMSINSDIRQSVAVEPEQQNSSSKPLEEGRDLLAQSQQDRQKIFEELKQLETQ